MSVVVSKAKPGNYRHNQSEHNGLQKMKRSVFGSHQETPYVDFWIVVKK
jgi:hypothetical protein